MADVATLVFDIDSSGAVGAAKALAGLDRAAASTATMAARLNTSYRNANGQFVKQSEYIRDNTAEIRSLASAYNPVLAAQYRFADAQQQVARAVQLGVISADQQADVLRRLQAQYSQTSTAAGNMQATVGNQFAQLNDVVVTAWGGMNPALIGMQQGMQMVQGFAGQSLPQALGTLRGAFAQLLNPVTLVTIGAVAAGAAIIQMGASLFSASEDAESAADAISAAAAANDKYMSSLKASRAPLDELVDKYGRLALVARQALENIAEVDRIDAYRKSIEALSVSVEAVTSYTWTGVNAGLDDAIAGVGRYNAAYGNLAVSLERVRNAQTELERLTAARALSAEMLAAYGSVEKMPAAMFELYTNLQKTIENTAAAKGATDSWAGSMSGVLSYLNSIAGVLSGIGGGAIQLAALKTETELLKQGRTLREASLAASKETAVLEGKQRTAELEAQYGIVGKGIAALETGQKLAIINAKEELSVQQDIAREREKTAASGGGGGRGAAELKAAERGFQSLRELLEQESIYQVAEYEKRQLQLEAALNKNLLTRQQYRILESQLQTFYFGTEHEKRQLQYDMELQQLKDFLELKKITQQQYNMAASQLHWGQVQALGQADANQYSLQLDHMSQNFAAMNQIAGGGYDSLLKAQKVFGAASALISTYTGAAEALKLPFPYNMMAAGKIIAAGLGFVNAIKGGGGTGKATASTATAATPAQQDPLKTYTINLSGDDMFAGAAEYFIERIQGALADGVILDVRRS